MSEKSGNRRPPRVVVENVSPQLARGRFAVKRTVGERLTVRADTHADGHDVVRALLLWRPESEQAWREVPMEPLGNDAWEAGFEVESLEPHRYTVEAWVDRFLTWRRDLAKRAAAKSQTEVDLLIGAELVEAAAARAKGDERGPLEAAGAALRSPGPLEERTRRGLEEGLRELMDRHPDRAHAERYAELPLAVDRPRALFTTWYEFFPRSCSAEAGRHGTLRDSEARVEYAAEMGFDVIYLPPIHPIGRVNRKGPNNNPVSAPGDLGSPWAIGAEEGGHTALHPQLGTLEDFRRLVEKARSLGAEIAMDLAFQCAPDHPWVKEHPQWFRWRPDGTVQYAENPPKKYQDIYPLEFENEDWKGLWEELKRVVEFWVAQGVRVFRVDNPHTKPYPFWEWLIAETRRQRPDLIFLAEAFTRPKVMARLARLGFNQSYTYFAWRNTKRELTEYLTDLTQTELAEYFRPSFWPNTPDILPEPLQFGGPPAFALRVLLAATLSASYGIYGPAFELCEGRPREPGSEEYLDSEKYQLRHWEVDRPDSLRHLIGRINRIRRENPALQQNRRLRFHTVDNEQIIAYSKTTEDLENVVLVVVNLDPHHTQAGWLELPLHELGLPEKGSFQVHDLLGDGRYFWNGPRNYVQLDPGQQPGHVFRARKRVRSERDFDYYL